MIFILYKLYCLSPYPNPTPYTKQKHFKIFKNLILCDVFVNLFPHWDQNNVPTRSKSTGITNENC